MKLIHDNSGFTVPRITKIYGSHDIRNCAGVPGFRAEMRVNYGCMVPGGIPVSSYRGKDGQSDKEASHVVAPLYIQNDSWDDLGMHMFQLRASLTCGMWTASSGFDPPQILENAATGLNDIRWGAV